MPTSLVHLLSDWAAKTPEQPALHGRPDSKAPWRTWTWAEYWRDARAVAKGLIALGHQPGECVAITGENRPEWVILELGIMAAGGVPAPLYTTNTAEQMAYICTNADARIILCDGQEQYDKLRGAVTGGAMRGEWFVTMDTLDGVPDDVLSFEGLIARGADILDADLDARIDALEETGTGLLIYTSGTTGTPKGVILEHGGMVDVAAALLERLSGFGPGGVPYRSVSYLPLCHGAEQLLTTLGHLTTGGEVYFCPNIKQIRDYLVDVRPTIFLGVPRVWEKFEAALSARFGERGAVAQKLLAWARRVELRAVDAEARTGRPVRSAKRTLANRLVLEKVRAAVGFDAMYFAVTGSAPISTHTLEFFASLGVVVSEAYGLSETTGVCTIGVPGQPRFGKVGRALRGVEIRIAEDGEVLLRGRTMTKGYRGLPEESAALYTDDGWMRTGDLGSLDAEGNLAITGRKKEILITAGGKNVAPVGLEAKLQQIDGIGQAVVVGDRKPYLCALLTIDPEAVPAMADRFGTAPTIEALAASAAFAAYVDGEVEAKCNAKVARVESVKKVAILPREFTIEDGELTGAMKIRRGPITEHFADTIAAFYDQVPART